jgi:hypothetical protein
MADLQLRAKHALISFSRGRNRALTHKVIQYILITKGVERARKKSTLLYQETDGYSEVQRRFGLAVVSLSTRLKNRSNKGS